MATVTRRSLKERMLGAARLDAATYEEVEADETATRQAAVVVAIAAVAQAIGGADEGAGTMIGGLIAGVIGWLAWSGITYLVGDKLFGGTASWGELLRTLGFAQTPGVFYVLGVIPLLGTLVRAGVSIWILLAGIVAIRQALDFGTGRAIATAVIGWLALAIPMAFFAGLTTLLF